MDAAFRASRSCRRQCLRYDSIVMRRPLAVASLVALASLSIVTGTAHASGDLFGDCTGCGGGGSGGSLVGSSQGKDGFHDLNKVLFSGAWIGIVLSSLYDVPYVAGFHPGDFRAMYWYGATAGAIATGFGIATLVDGATVHDGVGGVVFGGVATGLGGFAVATSIYRLMQADPRDDASPPAAAFVLDHSRIRIGQPSPIIFAGRF
jgi:hypothetical protein